MNALRPKVEKIVREVVMEWMAAAGETSSDGTDDPRARPLVAANWKMNHLSRDARAFARRLSSVSGVDILICPPAILLPVLAEALDPSFGIALGAQNIHHESKGAFTGEHSAASVRDAAASYVILGHSERRLLFNETDEDISKKLRAALLTGLVPIVCVGEQLFEREQGATFRVLASQLTASLSSLTIPLPAPSQIIIAYEPVWAIGTGLTASPHGANEAIAFIRDVLADKLGWGFAKRVRLLYGGSVTPSNAEELAREPEIDGFLVGGASLCADNLLAIARAAGLESRKETRKGSS